MVPFQGFAMATQHRIGAGIYRSDGRSAAQFKGQAGQIRSARLDALRETTRQSITKSTIRLQLSWELSVAANEERSTSG